MEKQSFNYTRSRRLTLITRRLILVNLNSMALQWQKTIRARGDMGRRRNVECSLADDRHFLAEPFRVRRVDEENEPWEVRFYRFDGKETFIFID